MDWRRAGDSESRVGVEIVVTVEAADIGGSEVMQWGEIFGEGGVGVC